MVGPDDGDDGLDRWLRDAINDARARFIFTITFLFLVHIHIVTPFYYFIFEPFQIMLTARM